MAVENHCGGGAGGLPGGGIAVGSPAMNVSLGAQKSLSVLIFCPLNC